MCKTKLAAVVLFVLGLACLVQAQVPMTGAGKGTPAVAAYVGPGDIVSGAHGWWGLRCYNTAYSGNVARIKSPSDALTTTITCSSGGVLGATGTALATTCATSCTVDILYDQSGFNDCSAAPCNAVQTTEANRPSLTLNCLGSLNCMTFTSGSMQLLTGNYDTTVGSRPWTVSAVVNRTGDTGNFRDFFNFDTTSLVGWTNSANTVRLSGSNQLTATMSDSAFHALQAIFATTPNCNLNVDASSNTGDCGSDGWNSGHPYIIGSNFSNSGFTGKISEVGIWPSGFSGNLTNMCHNQFVYWGTSTSC